MTRPPLGNGQATALLAVALTLGVTSFTARQRSARPAIATVQSGSLALRAWIWRPAGRGPFPAVLFNHGSYTTGDALPPGDPAAIGSAFARHGYVFFFLCRQGIGLSKGQGTADGEQMSRALAARGQEARNAVQMDLLEHEEMNEALAGLAVLRGLPDVDARRIAVVGHSFGGSLTLVMAARETAFRAAVVFGAAAASWQQSPALQARLLAAVRQTSTPVMFIHAANDYSTAPAETLDAEMARLGKVHLLKQYPAFGRTPREGHNLIYGSLGTWEADVFAFLQRHMQAK
ncbi:MAG TPA: dienelactone hydrolase family protein [Vicinamibacterales bacterium]|jgi:dienelactone hydrolase